MMEKRELDDDYLRLEKHCLTCVRKGLDMAEMILFEVCLAFEKHDESIK